MTDKEFNLKEKRKKLIEFMDKNFLEAYRLRQNPMLLIEEVEEIIKKQDKEFIRKTEEENKDFEEDIIDLIEINNYDKQDLISKMRRLCNAHKKERSKLIGEKLK